MSIEAGRVLIADGDRALRQQLFRRLLSADVYSDCVSTVPEALASLGRQDYGLVAIDMGLTGGSVEQLISHLAEIPVSDRPVVLILAGNPVAAKSLDVDVVQIVLRKPVDLMQLVELISNCVRGRPSRRASRADGDGEGHRPAT